MLGFNRGPRGRLVITPNELSSQNKEFTCLLTYLCAEAELRNLKSMYIPSAEATPHNLRQTIFRARKQNLKSQHLPYVEAELWNYKS